MNMHVQNLSSSSSLYIIFFITIFSHFTSPSNCALESFIYAGCSQLKYDPESTHESNVNSVFSSLVNSASFSIYNNFTISAPNDAVYGVFQCRGDQSGPDCRDCVVNAVSRLGSTCGGASGGALQLEGCFVRYDNVSFVGVQDKSVVFSKCGPSIGNDDQDLWTRRDGVLAYLTAGGQFYRVGGSGRVQGMVQCVQDLSMSDCQDCVTEAIQRLRSECGSSAWGDVFLGKCYARYSERVYSSNNGNDEEVEKTLAILIGLIAGVGLLVVFLAFLSKYFEKKGGK